MCIRDSNNINRRILKKRIYIENATSIIKKNERVITPLGHLLAKITSIQFRYILFIKYDLNLKTSLRFINLKRKDHNIKSYLGFVYLICLKHNIKILNKIMDPEFLWIGHLKDILVKIKSKMSTEALNNNNDYKKLCEICTKPADFVH